MSYVKIKDWGHCPRELEVVAREYGKGCCIRNTMGRVAGNGQDHPVSLVDYDPVPSSVAIF